MELEKTNTETTEAEKKVEDKVEDKKEDKVEEETTTTEGKLDKPADEESVNDAEGNEGEEINEDREAAKALLVENSKLQLDLLKMQDKYELLENKLELIENGVLNSKLEDAIEFYKHFKGDILEFKRKLPNLFVENEFGTNATDKSPKEKAPFDVVEYK